MFEKKYKYFVSFIMFDEYNHKGYGSFMCKGPKIKSEMETQELENAILRKIKRAKKAIIQNIVRI